MYVGNRKTRVYHHKTCYCINQILFDNQTKVNNELVDEDGVIYHACTKCLKTNDTISFD